tara:strand:+ start:828 stop:1142 length:315 start_codon:yes stop_codon:yes gene_type:complete
MQKFLSIPITATGETSQLVAINDVVIIEQLTTLKTTITYSSGKVATLTLGAVMAANDVTVRDLIQDSLVEALQTSWANPTFQVSFSGLTDAAGAAVTVAGIAVA